MLGSIIQGDPGECFVFWRSRCFRQRIINRYGIKYRRQTGNRISCSMGLLPDTENCALRRHREWRERFPPLPRVSDPDMHHGTCVTHVSWCKPWSLTRVYLWSQWRGKHSRHSRHMRNPQLYITGKRPMALSHNGSGCFSITCQISANATKVYCDFMSNRTAGRIITRPREFDSFCFTINRCGVPVHVTFLLLLSTMGWMLHESWFYPE